MTDARRAYDFPGFRGDTVATTAQHIVVGDFVVTRYATRDRLAFVCKITAKGVVYVRLFLDLDRSWGPAWQLCDRSGQADVVIQDGAQLPPRPRFWQATAARASTLRLPAAVPGC